MWDQRYSSAEFIYGKEANDFLQENYQRIPVGGRVLCLGEGEGRNAVFLAEQGYEVTAMDLSEVGLKKALQLAHDKGVTIDTQVADLADYDFGQDKWDGIISIWAHTSEAVRQRVHLQIAPALKAGGVFILEAYTFEHTTLPAVGGPPASQKGMFMSLENLRIELAALTEDIAVEKQRMVSEGEMHQGLSAVVQFVGHKS